MRPLGGGGRGREGEAPLWPLTLALRKDDGSTGQVRSPEVALAAHLSLLATGLPELSQMQLGRVSSFLAHGPASTQPGCLCGLL